MSKNIFIARRIPQKGIDLLKSRGFEVDVYPTDDVISEQELIRELGMKQYDAVIAVLTPIAVKVFDAAPTVKIYANYSTGFDNVDCAEAKKRGIVVTNAPGQNQSEAVGEFTCALIMALSKHIVPADKFVRAGKYAGWNPFIFVGSSLQNKTLGLVGAGHIGGKVAKFAKSLGLSIIYYDVVRNERIEKECGATYDANVESVLKAADIVSLHVPLLDSTRHLINEARLKLMKPTALLVNTSRGPVVDEVALEKALRNKTIAGAALDVYEFEPKVAAGLSELDNVILTPHIASASAEARDEMAVIAAQNVIDYVEGGVPKNIVNN